MTEVFKTGVVGARYVGLATRACLSHLGHRVMCVDKDEERIRGLKSGRMPFYEPGLEGLVSRCVRGERLIFATPDGLAELIAEADVIYLAARPEYRPFRMHSASRCICLTRSREMPSSPRSSANVAGSRLSRP